MYPITFLGNGCWNQCGQILLLCILITLSKFPQLEWPGDRALVKPLQTLSTLIVGQIYPGGYESSHE